MQQHHRVTPDNWMCLPNQLSTNHVPTTLCLSYSLSDTSMPTRTKGSEILDGCYSPPGQSGPESRRRVKLKPAHRSWRDGSVVNCFSRGPESSSHQPHCGSQLSVMGSNVLYWCVCPGSQNSLHISLKTVLGPKPSQDRP